MSFEQTILKGTTSKIIEVVLRDSTSGAGKTGVAHGDLTASYVREGSTRTAITLAAGTAGDAYSSGKWCEVDATNCAGLYQLHIPNAALASGVDAVTITLISTGVIDKVVRISLLDVDLRDATDAGLSNLDAAVSSLATAASIAALNDPSSADIADAVWDEAQSGHTTSGTFGYYLDAQVSSAGAGGSGLYQVTVNVQNQSAQALQGARINVDGTTLTLVTDSSGQCVFNLDSGVYLLTISPPAGYDTVAGNTVVVGTSDLSSTFTLTATSTGNGDVPWIG